MFLQPDLERHTKRSNFTTSNVFRPYPDIVHATSETTLTLSTAHSFGKVLRFDIYLTRRAKCGIKTFGWHKIYQLRLTKLCLLPSHPLDCCEVICVSSTNYALSRNIQFAVENLPYKDSKRTIVKKWSTLDQVCSQWAATVSNSSWTLSHVWWTNPTSRSTTENSLFLNVVSMYLIKSNLFCLDPIVHARPKPSSLDSVIYALNGAQFTRARDYGLLGTSFVYFQVLANPAVGEHFVAQYVNANIKFPACARWRDTPSRVLGSTFTSPQPSFTRLVLTLLNKTS